MDQCSSISPGLTSGDRLRSPLGIDHLLNRQIIRLGKGDVTLVVGRHAHDGPGAVFGEHVVGDPDRKNSSRQGVDDVTADGHTPLGSVIAGAFDRAEPRHLLFEGFDRRRLLSACQVVDLLVFRSQHHVARPGEGVGPGGEHGDRLVLGPFNAEGDFRAFGAADPVGLHGAYPFRPALERVKVVKKRFGVVGDA